MTQKSKDDVLLIERLALEVPNQYLGLITLNRPAQMNPLDWSLSRKMRKVMEDLAMDTEVRVIAFTGAGKAFSAGGDLKAYLTLQKSANASSNKLIYLPFEDIQLVSKQSRTYSRSLPINLG